MCKYQIVKIMMDWKRLISAKRFGMEEFHEERQENRSEFQRDYDRLVFSAPFDTSLPNERPTQDTSRLCVSRL